MHHGPSNRVMIAAPSRLPNLTAIVVLAAVAAQGPLGSGSAPKAHHRPSDIPPPHPANGETRRQLREDRFTGPCGS